MNSVSTTSAVSLTKTSAILKGSLVSKDSVVLGAAFVIKEGTSGDPVVESDQIVGIIQGDVPVCAFASTVINLLPNTSYRFRAISAVEGKSSKYVTDPVFPGYYIVSDDGGLANGVTVVTFSFTAATKQIIIYNEVGSWNIDLSVTGTFTLNVPESMGSQGWQTITFHIDSSLLPTEDMTGTLTITKTELAVTFFYGNTIQFKTKRK